MIEGNTIKLSWVKNADAKCEGTAYRVVGGAFDTGTIVLPTEGNVDVLVPEKAESVVYKASVFSKSTAAAIGAGYYNSEDVSISVTIPPKAAPLAMKSRMRPIE